MNQRIYSTKNERSAEFAHFDGSGWYKEIATDEFTALLQSGKIRHASGRYFATSSFDEAKAAAEGMGPAPIDAAYENPAPQPDRSFTTSSGGIYTNPGVTLKTIAKAVFIIGAVASLILAIVLGRSVDFWTGESTLNIGLFIGILLGGVLVSYLTGLGLAALGDIAKNLNEINRKIK